MFDPAGVAVVGASQIPGKLGYEAMANATEFDRPIYPVNPSSSGSLFGEPFVASVTDVDNVDLALLCVPSSAVTDVIEECGAASIGAAVVYASGFAETDKNGEELQAKVVELANKHDIALLGPNTSGFIVPETNLLCSFASGVEQVPSGKTAILAQSGGIAHVLAFQTRRQGRGISAMVGLGNRANVGFEETIEYFERDDRTDAIVIHIEGTDDARGLLEACRAAETPIVAYKVGQADVGEFTASHTGALTGDHELYKAGFAQHGVPTVEATDHLLDAAAALAGSTEPDGPNVGVVTAQAGPGIIIADRIQRSGGLLPQLTEVSNKQLADILPGVTYAGNPVDTGRPMPEFGEVVTIVAEDDNIDIVLVYELFEASLGFPIDALTDLTDRLDKPILFATEGINEDMADERAALKDADIPLFETPERAGEAAGVLAHYAQPDGDGADEREVNVDD